MKPDIRHIILAGIVPLFLIFILYMIKIWETGMDWQFTQLGVYPSEVKGLLGIFTSPLIHNGFTHLIANSLPLFFLSWCLYYFYRDIASYILLILWISTGVLTFLIGKPGWHIGASGLIYGLAFFLFLSGLLRKYAPLIAISLLVTFLYGGLVWNMFPHFTPSNTSWEGHLSGAVSGVLCALAFRHYGPQRPNPFADESDEEPEESFDEIPESESDEYETGSNEEEVKEEGATDKLTLSNMSSRYSTCICCTSSIRLF